MTDAQLSTKAHCRLLVVPRDLRHSIHVSYLHHQILLYSIKYFRTGLIIRPFDHCHQRRLACSRIGYGEQLLSGRCDWRTLARHRQVFRTGVPFILLPLRLKPRPSPLICTNLVGRSRRSGPLASAAPGVNTAPHESQCTRSSHYCSFLPFAIIQVYFL